MPIMRHNAINHYVDTGEYKRIAPSKSIWISDGACIVSNPAMDYRGYFKKQRQLLQILREDGTLVGVEQMDIGFSCYYCFGELVLEYREGALTCRPRMDFTTFPTNMRPKKHPAAT